MRQCDPCQRSKVEQARLAGLMGQCIVEQPWVVAASDVMGPFPGSKSGHKYLVVFQELFAMWVEVVPIRTANEPTMKGQFEDLLVSRWGVPEVVHTDNGTEFSKRRIEQMCKRMGIVHTTNPVYHAQANPIERVNRILKTMKVAFLTDDHRHWDLHLHEFRFAYNTAVHGSLKVTPAFLNFGRELLLYRSLRKEVDVKTQRCVPEPTDWKE